MIAVLLAALGAAVAYTGAQVAARGTERARAGEEQARALSTVEAQLTIDPDELLVRWLVSRDLAHSGVELARRGRLVTLVGFVLTAAGAVLAVFDILI